MATPSLSILTRSALLRAETSPWWAIACGAIACSSPPGPEENVGTFLPPAPSDGVAADTLAYAPCPPAERVGQFRVELAEDYTRFDGKVWDSVSALQNTEAKATEGSCWLLQPEPPLCDPLCAFSTEQCTLEGCVAIPRTVDLGPLYLYGLAQPLSLEAHPVTGKYSNPASPPLPHPGFATGADIRLVGTGQYADLQLRGYGIEALVPLSNPVSITEGQDIAVQWEPSARPTPSRVIATLNLDNHGSSNASVHCEFEDTGSGTIASSLIDNLLNAGTSGFPTLLLERRTANQTPFAGTCLQLQVASPRAVGLLVDGLTSCNTDEDCPNDSTCKPLARYCE